MATLAQIPMQSSRKRMERSVRAAHKFINGLDVSKMVEKNVEINEHSGRLTTGRTEQSIVVMQSGREIVELPSMIYQRM